MRFVNRIIFILIAATISLQAQNGSVSTNFTSGPCAKPPSITAVQTVAASTTADVLIEGEYFISDMSIMLDGANTINSISYINSTSIIVNITSSSTVGTYPITISDKCGTAADFLIVLDNLCYIPNDNVSWVNVSGNLMLDVGELVKSGTMSNGWTNNAYFGSASGDVELCWTIDGHSGNVPIMFGLNDNTTVTSHTSIEHKFYLIVRPGNYANLNVRNNNSSTTILTLGATGDFAGYELCIERVGTTVNYYYTAPGGSKTLAQTTTSLISGDVYAAVSAYYTTFWNGKLRYDNIQLCEK